jgi:hypothetical protein
MTYSTLIEVWEQTSCEDKLFIINMFGSFGEWMNISLMKMGVM